MSWSPLTNEESSDEEEGEQEEQEVESKATPKQTEGGVKDPGPSPIPSQTSPKPASQTSRQSRIRCDRCNKSVNQDPSYYHCRSCPDFDLCTKCLALGCEISQHHKFTKMKPSSASPPVPSTSSNPSPSPLPYRPANKPTRSRIDCDSCNRKDMLLYYRCRVCSDFDLCEECFLEVGMGCEVDPRHGFDRVKWKEGREWLV